MKEYTRTVARFPQALPLGARLHAVERGQPLLAADVQAPRARRRVLQRPARALQELHGRRRRRARPAEHGPVAAHASAATPRATRGCGGCTTTSTPTACAPPARSTCSSAVQGHDLDDRDRRHRAPHALQAADRGFEESPAHAATATRLDPAPGQPLSAHPPRLPLPVERELDDPGVGLRADRRVRRAPPRASTCSRGRWAATRTRRPRAPRDARPAPFNEQPPPRPTPASPAAVGDQQPASGASGSGASPSPPPPNPPPSAAAVHAADLHARRLALYSRT